MDEWGSVVTGPEGTQEEGQIGGKEEKMLHLFPVKLDL